MYGLLPLDYLFSQEDRLKVNYDSEQKINNLYKSDNLFISKDIIYDNFVKDYYANSFINDSIRVINLNPLDNANLAMTTISKELILSKDLNNSITLSIHSSVEYIRSLSLY